MIGSRARVELLHQLAGQRVHLLVDRIAVVRAGRAHDVALHVAAGGQRGKLHFVDPPDGLLEILFQDAVELQALPGGDAQRGVADFVAEIELGQQLVAGDPAAGDGGADHEAVELGLGRAIDAGFGAALAVVLLIRAVMLEKLGAVFADEVVAVAQLFGDRAAKIVALRLGDFNRAELFRVTVLGCVRHCMFTKSLNITQLMSTTIE